MEDNSTAGFQCLSRENWFHAENRYSPLLVSFHISWWLTSSGSTLETIQASTSNCTSGFTTGEYSANALNLFFPFLELLPHAFTECTRKPRKVVMSFAYGFLRRSGFSTAYLRFFPCPQLLHTHTSRHCSPSPSHSSSGRHKAERKRFSCVARKRTAVWPSQSSNVGCSPFFFLPVRPARPLRCIISFLHHVYIYCTYSM